MEMGGTSLGPGRITLENPFCHFTIKKNNAGKRQRRRSQSETGMGWGGGAGRKTSKDFKLRDQF